MELIVYWGKISSEQIQQQYMITMFKELCSKTIREEEAIKMESGRIH